MVVLQARETEILNDLVIALKILEPEAGAPADGVEQLITTNISSAPILPENTALLLANQEVIAQISHQPHISQFLVYLLAFIFNNKPLANIFKGFINWLSFICDSFIQLIFSTYPLGIPCCLQALEKLKLSMRQLEFNHGFKLLKLCFYWK